MSAVFPLEGRVPAGIHCASDYESLARGAVDPATFAYIAGGSGRGECVLANREAFDGWTVCPRVLRDVRAGEIGVDLTGTILEHPILLAPWAHHALVHPRAEIETVRGAEAVGACMVASTLSSRTLEDIARAALGPKWFQLYFQPQRDATRDLILRAQDAGYRAIMLTVDAPVQVPSLQSQRAGFSMPATSVAANLSTYPAPPLSLTPAQSRVFSGFMRFAPRWEGIDWMLDVATVPVWIKGVLHPEDAAALQAKGVAGIVVSNHGGRALDVAPASLDALPGVRAAVGPEYPLLVDGGIRSGADVFKALALGADAVMIGRLQSYALAVAGALGVAHLVKLLREELEVTMALAGCGSLKEIRHATLQPVRQRTAFAGE